MKSKIVFLILGLLIVSLLLSQHIVRIPVFLQGVFEWVGRHGVMAPVIFIAVFTLGTFLLMPILLMSMSGGLLFGVIPGGLAVTFSMVFSSALSFLIGRCSARDWAYRQIEKKRFLQTLDRAVKRAGWKIVLLTRIAPIFPFTPLNFAYGLSKIRFRDFCLASLAGMFPGSFLNAYLGAVAGTLIGVHDRTPSPGEWVFLGVAVSAAVMATLYMTRLTRRILAESAE